MKFVMLFVFGLTCITINAQNCTNHALMKKGVELEYDIYAPRMSVFGKDKGLFKMSAITLVVDHVFDSAGSTYSRITKKGVSLNDKKDAYESKMLIQCDGKNLLLPYDFYASDTIYLSDIYDNLKGKGFYFANAPQADAVTYIIPLALEGVKKLPEWKKSIELKSTMRTYKVDVYAPPSSAPTISVNKFTSVMRINNTKIDGKQTITTYAGSFECYKIVMDCNFSTEGISMPSTVILYFNPEIGLVKSEALQANNRTSSIELVKVKK